MEHIFGGSAGGAWNLWRLCRGPVDLTTLCRTCLRPKNEPQSRRGTEMDEIRKPIRLDSRISDFTLLAYSGPLLLCGSKPASLLASYSQWITHGQPSVLMRTIHRRGAETPRRHAKYTLKTTSTALLGRAEFATRSPPDLRKLSSPCLCDSAVMPLMSNSCQTPSSLPACGTAQGAADILGPLSN